MDIPTDSTKQLVLPNYPIQISRLLITKISIEQDTPLVLYQVPFELSMTPNRAWKEALMENWSSISKLRFRALKTIIWVYHNRVLINNVTIELFQEDLEKMPPYIQMYFLSKLI